MMESENIYQNAEAINCIKSSERDPKTEDLYANEDTFIQTEAKAQNHGGSGRFMLSTVFFGLICVLLVVGIIVQHNKLTKERELLNLSYTNIVKEYNQTINRLQVNYSDQTIEKDQLQSRFNSLNKKKLQLETEIKKKNSQKGWYFISSEEKSWSDSRQFCRDHGGDLLIINSEEEQRLISSFKQNVWIGLSDIKQEGDMKWVNNSPLNEGFWKENEPNNLGGNEDCVVLDPALPVLKNWNDLLCSQKRKWIFSDITIELEHIHNSYSHQNKLETKVKSSSDELKKKDSERDMKSWSDSRQFCRDHGGDLLIINSEEEQRYITSLIKQRAWIGLSDIEKEGNIKWVDNTPLNKGAISARRTTSGIQMNGRDWNAQRSTDEERKSRLTVDRSCTIMTEYSVSRAFQR
ncbi:CD209 antigen-like protein 2 [Myxocyprinus asiaticus]|uniref:CD209 antigen-like protein 2 n=1 Tax=Myxocyprinus asiaticus TaxID=70543 RepID=UPI0022235B40|nr:CD209 antigen-like protein 2 [Myxocyprinus asiaticus]